MNSERTVGELLTFIITENGKVEADDGYNDDLVMSLALTAYVFNDIRDGAPLAPTANRPADEKNTQFEVPLKTSRDLTNEDISWVIE